MVRSTAPEAGRIEQPAGADTVANGAAPARTRPVYLPALDGIRGLAIPMVLLYHGNITWLTSGMLTVSMFFTLSGFLITRLMIGEFAGTATISMRSFYERRVRRLLPASFMLLLGVAAIWTIFPGNGRRLGSFEWFSGLTYWENTYLLVAGKNYSGLFGLANPLQHLWSLSLEEQVYIIYPIIAITVLRRSAGRPGNAALWRLFGALSGLAVIGYALGPWYESHGPLWASIPGLGSRCQGISCAYYSTEVRSAEFFIGAAFAVLLAAWQNSPRMLEALRRPGPRAVGWLLLAFEVWLWWNVGYENSWSKLFFPWGVLLNGVVVVAIMAYASAGGGVATFLSWAPFVAVGQITYTIYLVHWPVFLLVNSWRLDPNMPLLEMPLTGWRTVDGFWIFLLKLAITMAVVLAIYHLVENPVRRKKLWAGKKLILPLALIALVGASFIVLGAGRRTAASDDILSKLNEDALKLQQSAIAALPEVPADAPSSSPTDLELPARVLVVGDSQSWVIAGGLSDWEKRTGVFLEPSPGVGCGIAENTPIRYLGVEQEERPGCTPWRNALPQLVNKLKPNTVMIVGGTADLSDRRLPGSNRWQHIGQPEYDAWLLDQMQRFANDISASGARVVWLTSPDIRPVYQAGQTGIPPFDEADPARTARYNELIRQIAETDERVEFADFAAAVRAHAGGQFDPDMRPDGAHLDLKAAPELVEWIDRTLRDTHTG